ncbi:hypothetical protein KIL84_010448 [Mauremys mutica]|uniref:Alcohol dehydrogenase iron-containing protein 1 n=1 Tax=Mauremys mutica TaxID=74926 RepID=A0A9D4B1E5_9SAUR|nr:hypothetical protein KIL84_010448 [Mauremys mutica]
MRSPCPSNPINRPAYQGSNPITTWSFCGTHLPRSIYFHSRDVPRTALGGCRDTRYESLFIKPTGADIRTAKIKDAGLILADTLRKFLFDLNVDDGLAAIGYSKADIPALVKGTLPQERVTKLSPRPQTEEELSALFEASMKLY